MREVSTAGAPGRSAQGGDRFPVTADGATRVLSWPRGSWLGPQTQWGLLLRTGRRISRTCMATRVTRKCPPLESTPSLPWRRQERCLPYRLSPCPLTHLPEQAMCVTGNARFPQAPELSCYSREHSFLRSRKVEAIPLFALCFTPPSNVVEGRIHFPVCPSISALRTDWSLREPEGSPSYFSDRKHAGAFPLIRV